MDSVIEYRRERLDASAYALRSVMIAASPSHASLNLDRPYPMTSEWARTMVEAARQIAADADAVRKDRAHEACSVYVGSLCGALITLAASVSYDADSLDRAIRASTDDASAAADGASLVGAA